MVTGLLCECEQNYSIKVHPVKHRENTMLPKRDTRYVFEEFVHVGGGEHVK